MTITNRQELADHALRRLGGGVVEVEVSPEQLEDAVQLAIDFYIENHYDGIERDYLARTLSASVLNTASTAGFAVGDTLTGVTSGAQAVVTALTSTKFTLAKISTTAKFANAETVTNGTTSVALTTVVLGDVDNGFIAVDDTVVGVVKVLNPATFYNSGDMLFNPQYQLMMNEIYNMTSSGGVQYYFSVMQYMSHLNFVLTKEKSFRFNRRWNKIYLDINWGTDLKIGDPIVIEVYKALDDDAYPEMLNDRWLKEYTAAQIKYYWGSNLKKYSDMTLPGGLRYNGQKIWDEAAEEIKALEDQAIGSSAPLYWEVG